MHLWHSGYDPKTRLRHHTTKAGFGHALFSPLVLYAFRDLRVSAALWEHGPEWWAIHSEPTLQSLAPQDILTLHIDNAPAAIPASLPEHLRAIEPLDTSSATPQSVVIEYARGVDGGPPPPNEAYTINGKSFDTMLMGRVNETDVFTVDNRTDWDHPFHLHGFFFQPLDEHGTPVHEWKDTFNVPVKSMRRFVVRYDDRAGNWMFHCHVLDHTEVGLMGMLMLEP